MNLAIYISGTGSNFLAIQSAIDNGSLRSKITLVVSNNKDALGLNEAKRRNIPTAVFDRKTYNKGSQFATAMLATLRNYQTECIVLAGYMRKLPPRVVREFRGRIVNIHPAILPRFGGKGMYGLHVHEAVLDSGVPETGVSVHLVDEEYDHGAVIAQLRVVVGSDDTPETLQKRVLRSEHALYPEVIERLSIIINRDSEYNEC